MKQGIRSLVLGLAASLVLTTLAAAQIHDPRAIEADPATADRPIAPVLEGLGDHHFEVTTDNPRSQAFFDQGLRLTYGFNHSEALRAFKEAARLDPDNAMAYWGWALVLGPTLPMVPDVVEQAWKAMQMAVERKNQVSEKERAYIEALATRYTDDPEADRAPLDAAYAEAMEGLVARYPDDLDAATLYGASLMNLSPWNYWTLDGKPRQNTEKFLAVLQSVVDRDPSHAGALHYYIHAVEAPHPERGVAAADRLAGLMPGAGHMVHMPSHIYMRVGRYGDSYDANAKAVEADEGYITSCRAQGIYPLAYYPHNLHFMVWSAMFQGRQEAAIETAEKIAAKIPDHLQGDTWALYETFRSQPIYALVRFGQWDRILQQPEPAAEARFMRGAWHYARGLALLHKGQRGKAKRELKLLESLRDGLADEPYPMGFSAAGTLLTIASDILAGEMAASRRNWDEALVRLERAVRLEDGLLYNEPPDWYFPVRHILGAVLLEAGRPREAEVVYWQDLRKNPENGWALFGLHRSLEAQMRTDEAVEMRKRFEVAWADADHELRSSRW